MDFIMAYPDEKTAFIGFFMTETSIQNTGTAQQLPDLDLRILIHDVQHLDEIPDDLPGVQ